MRTAKKDDRESFVAIVRGAGLRVTSSRIAVLSALHEATMPLSHADVAAKLEHLGVDRTTVYRNLIDLAEAGVLRRSDVGHTWRFELSARDDEHDAGQHPHFVCTDCGKVACLPTSAVSLKAVRGSPAALKRGNLEIQLRGLCDVCA
ncbi:MAG: Fur family transcriptional regulator [Myxococcaceae bacterium]|nr:Fur family transcriptional regulator [Myxococcaceae bacterium]